MEIMFAVITGAGTAVGLIYGGYMLARERLILATALIVFGNFAFTGAIVRPHLFASTPPATTQPAQVEAE